VVFPVSCCMVICQRLLLAVSMFLDFPMSWFFPVAYFLCNGGATACSLSGNTENGGTVLLIVNLVADSESGSPVSYLSFLGIIRLSRSVLDIFACDT